jgi:hypothetical protein
MKGIAAVSYRVEFEAGGVSHILAGGLNDAGSFAVMTDVNRVLGFTS